ncbi:MAG: hypothetical protein MUC31_04955 [Bacteroidales bacterium]|nr:hypothetical protein [Bacteroidales bacterium]
MENLPSITVFLMMFNPFRVYGLQGQLSYNNQCPTGKVFPEIHYRFFDGFNPYRVYGLQGVYRASIRSIINALQAKYFQKSITA